MGQGPDVATQVQRIGSTGEIAQAPRRDKSDVVSIFISIANEKMHNCRHKRSHAGYRFIHP